MKSKVFTQTKHYREFRYFSPWGFALPCEPQRFSSEWIFWELPLSKFVNYVCRDWTFSDLNYIFSSDKANPTSHKYFIRKMKTCELVLQIRCQGLRKKNANKRLNFRKKTNEEIHSKLTYFKRKKNTLYAHLYT